MGAGDEVVVLGGGGAGIMHWLCTQTWPTPQGGLQLFCARAAPVKSKTAVATVAAAAHGRDVRAIPEKTRDFVIETAFRFGLWTVRSIAFDRTMCVPV
jgi:hypothetical protein